MEKLIIKKVKISGIGGITEIAIPFSSGVNLICGTNGIGKTTILECISHIFISTGTQKLKRNVNYSKGKCEIDYMNNDKEASISYELTHFNPTGDADYLNRMSNKSNLVLFFTAQRDINYNNLEHLSRDPIREQNQTAGAAYSGISANDIKNWFIQRYMWSAHRDALAIEQISNLEKAKECFNILDNSVAFSRVIPDSYDIMLTTPNGEVYFEYLTSGYKSCLYILLGIIKEIEYRFKKPYLNIQDFSGVILIDEIDVHLHPQWQKSLLEGLRNMLPCAQIIATTHSPSMIQCAKPNEIIPLRFDEQYNIEISDFGSKEYGFQGWTVEEILVDVMGMTSTRSEYFTSQMQVFEKAISDGDDAMAKNSYQILKKMLNPRNPLRKLLDFEMIGMNQDD